MKKTMKKIIATILTAAMAISVGMPAFAAENVKINENNIVREQIDVEKVDLLIEKYGEWIIGTGGSGFTITFIHIGHALFSGLAITNAICSVVFLVSAYVIGKWFLPRLSTQIITNNQDMVNLTILQNSNKE